MANRAGPWAQSILTNGFGIIAFISVTPLIAVQCLGILYDVRSRKMQKALEDDLDEELEDLEDFCALADPDSEEYQQRCVAMEGLKGEQ